MTYETKKNTETAILIGIDYENPGFTIEASLDELAELAATAGAEAVDRLSQKRAVPNRATYLGKGKLDEVEDLVNLHDATMLIFDDELSPAQMRNLNDRFDIKIIDRTLLILDIFASRASSAEGKVQVELAQLRYRASHLGGMGKAMSRLAGGIGTRGPGESKLETDRRHIRNRITVLSQELEEVRQHRSVLRERREKDGVFIASLVGYTNAGKSSLLNYLTESTVLAEDKLFATLDTTTRRLTLPNRREILLTDTVGFIQKLPHNLIKAFRATLEELTYADLLIHVVDASSPLREERMGVVYETLEGLDCLERPILTIYNKMDLPVERPLPRDSYAEETLEFSVKSGSGTAELLSKFEEISGRGKRRLHVLIPYSNGSILNMIHKNCEIFSESHQAEGTQLEILADADDAGRLKDYIMNSEEN